MRLENAAATLAFRAVQAAVGKGQSVLLSAEEVVLAGARKDMALHLDFQTAGLTGRVTVETNDHVGDQPFVAGLFPLDAVVEFFASADPKGVTKVEGAGFLTLTCGPREAGWRRSDDQWPESIALPETKPETARRELEEILNDHACGVALLPADAKVLDRGIRKAVRLIGVVLPPFLNLAYYVGPSPVLVYQGHWFNVEFSVKAFTAPPKEKVA